METNRDFKDVIAWTLPVATKTFERRGRGITYKVRNGKQQKQTNCDSGCWPAAATRGEEILPDALGDALLHVRQ